MSASSTLRRLTLASGQLIDLDDARGTVVRVGRGRVWVTQHGDLADHVLEAGDTWAIERNGRTIVEAQQETILDLSGPGAAAVVVPIAAPAAPRQVDHWLTRVANDLLAPRWLPYV